MVKKSDNFDMRTGEIETVRGVNERTLEVRRY